MGDFAVRAFASFETFEKLLRVSRSQRPDLLLIDRDDVKWDDRRLLDFLDFHFGETPVILLAATPHACKLPARIFPLAKPVDGLGLSLFADFVLRSTGGARRHVIRYKGLLLDSERLECLVQPGEEPVSLPLKEAQLLRLLLEKAGMCLSRDVIQKTIWEDVRVAPRTIDSHVSRLRKRLDGSAIEIESVYGGGYRLK